MYKKVISVLLVVLLICSLAACGKGQTETPVDIESLQKEIEAADLFIDTFVSVDANVLSSVMYLATDDIEEFMVYMGSGYTAEEYGVFRCISEETASELVERLRVRVDAQKAIYLDYAPDAMPRLNNAVIKQQGSAVAYVVAEKYGDALKIVEKYIK